MDYFKEMEESRPIAELIRNNPASSMSKEMIVFNISRDIVKVIIHQLLLDYDPDDSAEGDNKTTENVEDIFTLVNGDNEASWSNKLQFAMIVSHILVGISFCQCSQLLLHSKEITGFGEIGNISVGKVIQVVQYTFETI
jgi:hypothetical protein